MFDDTTTRLSAIQRAVASASPSAFQDAIVVEAGEGRVALLTLDGSSIRLSTDAELTAGDPVGYPPVAEVLGFAGNWYAAR